MVVILTYSLQSVLGSLGEKTATCQISPRLCGPQPTVKLSTPRKLRSLFKCDCLLANFHSKNEPFRSASIAGRPTLRREQQQPAATRVDR